MPTFRVLRALRGLRGTRWDVFGYAHLRRVERALVGEYRDLVRSALDRLRPDTVDAVVAIAELTDLVRGYEDIKLAGRGRLPRAGRRRRSPSWIPAHSSQA